MSITAECWTLQGADSKKCKKLPDAPQNLTVTATPVNKSSVMLQISWQPPAHYFPDIIAYRIDVFINGSFGYCDFTNGVSRHFN